MRAILEIIGMIFIGISLIIFLQITPATKIGASAGLIGLVGILLLLFSKS